MERGGKTVALVVAAGCGQRAGGGLPKQYRRIGGTALLAHAIDHLRHPGIDEVRVVIGHGQQDAYRAAVEDRTLGEPVTGGETRQRSVINGLEALGDDVGTVLIHDAARPFLPAEVIDRLLKALAEAGAAVPVMQVVDTLSRGVGELGEPVAREGLVRVQTPQAFRLNIIRDAHRRWAGAADATDDAQVARASGVVVRLVEGSRLLDKLTYEEDFMAAEERLSGALISRTGLGFDVHAFADGETLWLGGVEIPHSRGLKGHSDADAVLHALTDALLGAVGAGDIGDHFPPSDPQWRGAASSLFLDHARALIEARGGRIDHVDLTIICEAPRIGPHRDAIRARIAELLRVPHARVSVKATTPERLGFTGRGEGIATQAAATVRAPEER